MKRLIRALLWIVCWGGICWIGIKSKLGFDILEIQNWKMLFDHSPRQIWPVDMAPKKLVCKILLIFIIIGILGFSVAIKRKKTRIPVVKGELPPENTGFRPPPLASQGKMVSTNPAPAPVVATETGELRAPEQPTGHALGTMAEAVQRITNFANGFQLTVFPHVKLENTFTHLVLSDDIIALMLKILPVDGTWKMQENPDPAESIWTLNDQESQNVLKDILQSSQVLRKLEPEANVISVVILTNGNLQNPENIKQYLTQNGIRIATLLPDNRRVDGIQSLDELLSEFFEKKEGETQS